MELLRQRHHEEAAALAAARRGGVRMLTARLWDTDAAIRDAAAAAMGHLGAHAPDKLREVLRGFIWALNDESGTNGAAVLPAMAAVARAAPRAVAVHLGALVALLDDDGLRPQVASVLEAVAKDAPETFAAHREDVRRWAVSTQDVRLAALAAGLEGGKTDDHTE